MSDAFVFQRGFADSALTETNLRIVTRLTDMGDGTHAEVSAVTGLGYTSEVTLTRPSNTTAYTAGDVIGIADATVAANAGSAILALANIGPSGGQILVTNVDLAINVGAIPSGMTTFRLHLYDASPTAILDNAAWDLIAADRASHIGYIDLGNIADLGSTLYVQTDNINRQLKLAAGSTTLYGVLVTNGGFTPSSGAVKKLRVSTVAV